MIAPKTALLIGTHVAALGLGAALHNGLVYQPHLKKDAQVQLRVETAARKTEQAAAKISTEARDALDNQKETVRVVTRETLKAIPVYLAAVGDTGGDRGPDSGDQRPQGSSPGEARRGGAPLPAPALSVGFGRLHDYAALGVTPPVPAPSGEPLGSPSGIGLPALAGTITENYGVCRSDWAEVEAWRAWYKKEVAAWGSK